MENTTFKDNPKFLIASTVMVPITVSVIGLAGIIVPNLINQQQNNSSALNPAVVSNAQGIEQQISTKPEIVVEKDSFGYLNAGMIVNSFKSENISLNPSKSTGDYEVQKISGEYYVLGFSENTDISSLKLTSSLQGDFKKIVAVKFKDIITISNETVKEKKNSFNVLSIKANSLRSDLVTH